MKKLLLFAAVCVFLLVCACDSESPKNQQPERTAVVSKKISTPKQETGGKLAKNTAEESESPTETSAEEKEKTAAGKTAAAPSKDQKPVSPESEVPKEKSGGVTVAEKSNVKAPPEPEKKDVTGSGAEKETAQTGNTSEDRNKQTAPEKQARDSKTDEAQESNTSEKETVSDNKTAAAGKDVSEKPIEDILMNTDAAYASAGKIDPFEPLIKTEKEEKEAEVKEPEEKKPRRKLTPLEKLDLSQLKLVAVVDVKGGVNFAMVQEASGKGYIVKVGTYIGKNSGKITEITDDRIIIKERIKNFKGEYETDYKEMKLQKKNKL